MFIYFFVDFNKYKTWLEFIRCWFFFIFICDFHIYINVREYRRGNKKNGQTREIGNKTKKNKAKTQHNMC